MAASLAAALEVPKLAGRVNDQANLLSPQSKARLEQQLAEYERSVGHQFALLTVSSLEGDPIEDLSIRVVEAWQLGQKKNDNGLLLLVAAEERKVRIEVGYGLEGDIPDVIASRIIREVIVPAFRRRQYEAGILTAFDLLMQKGRGLEVEVPTASRTQEEYDPRAIWIFFLVLGGPMLLPLLFGRRRGSRGRRGPFIGGFFGGGFGGGRGGGFGGGGFSGGGGGFGGGGASGGW